VLLARGERTGRALLVAVLVVAAAAGGMALRSSIGGRDQIEAPAPDRVEGGDTQRTLLVVSPQDGEDPVQARLILLLAHDLDSGESSVLLIPTGTLTEVPGHGLQLLRDAQRFGGTALVAATVGNLLGIDIDASAEVTRRDWASVFTRVQPLEVEVRDRLVEVQPDGQRTVRFVPGVSLLEGPALADLLLFRNPDEGELDALSRTQRLFDTLLEALDDVDTFDELFADGAPMIATAMPRTELTELFAGLVATAREATLDQRTLPVTPVGDRDDDAYRPDAGRIEVLVADRFAGSIPSEVTAVRDLQVLNGDGRPGLGAAVAERVLPAGFRVVLTGNADTFDHARTLVIVYHDDPDHLAAANRLVELLGVGQVQISNTTQSVADITIVLGADFQP